MNCSFCQKLLSTPRSLSSHERLCKLNPNHTVSWLEKNYTHKPKAERVLNNQYTKAAQEGRTHAVTAETKMRMSVKAKKNTHSAETKAKLSLIAKRRGLGGHTSKQKIWFQKSDGTEIFLQSSYELRFAVLLDKFEIEWTRPEPLSWVDEKGLEHKYYPDFLVGTV